ncbi:MAG: hypothetical protein M1165_02195 [Candidatus Pacearchaeota archaeon]|nr:hypothetical protein [Candidatus Pacearchaeota archaeon]
MPGLTEDLLKEAANEYFPRVGASFSDGDNLGGSSINVFPGYAHWRENMQGNHPPAFRGNKVPAWAMDDYISEAVMLAAYLLRNGYPQKNVLEMLPRGFALYVSKKLRKNFPEKNANSSG